MRRQGGRRPFRLPFTLPFRVPFRLVEVTGPSMVPTLLHGDWLLVQYIQNAEGEVREGDVVVLRHPLQQDLLIVKRAARRREGGWWVLGDNAFVRNDSREFGTVPDELVVARGRGRFRPPWEVQRSPAGVVSWAASCVRVLKADRSCSRRLRAR
jgi:nickel-type superoxide dismutase maturation protease